MLKKIISIGATGGCADLIDLIDQINANAPRFELIGAVDDRFEQDDLSIHGVRILGGFNLINELKKDAELHFVTAIGNEVNFKNRKLAISQFGIPNDRWVTLVHPLAIVSKLATIGQGSYIHGGVLLGPNVVIQDHCIILPNVVVGHDSHICEYSIINSGVNIGGNSIIRSSCYIALGSNIRDHVEIGENTIVGMGSSVTTDCDSNSIYLGTPARKHEKN